MADKQYTDAIMLLRADHDEVKALFKQFENAEGREDKQTIAEQICNELKIHTMIEEEIFYPALRGEIEEEDMIDEAIVEHDGAKVLINDIMAGGPDEEFYDAKVKVLQEQIEHHVEEEEQAREGMFAQAREADVDLKALLEPMLARKEELTAQAESGGLPPAKLSAVES
ncbi:MAG: hemerythrin domain-containing protein [Cypionkella sp.]